MDILKNLQEKIEFLVDTVKKLKFEKEQLLLEKEQILSAKELLIEENGELKIKLANLENSLLKETKNIDDLSQERAMTKMVVDDLIKSIDLLVEESK